MDIARTPEAWFADLPDFPYRARRVDVGGLGMAYVDEGPRDGPPVADAARRADLGLPLPAHDPAPSSTPGCGRVVPDLIGFGRSDKPTSTADYTLPAARRLDDRARRGARPARASRLFCQDWGSLIGLRVAAEQRQRFRRIVVANGFLPTGQRGSPLAFRAWRGFARYTPDFRAGLIVAVGSEREGARPRRRAAYDAPFPTRRHLAGARVFPELVPTTPDDPAVPAEPGGVGGPRSLGEAVPDPLRPQGPDPRWPRRPAPGPRPRSEGRPHQRLDGSHFVQEDCGPELARHTIDLIRATPA